MPRLERRPSPSRWMMLASPVIAAALMLATGVLLFALMGKAPLGAMYTFFVQPLTTQYGIGEWLLKATPLALCGLGLAVGFRACVWNIGAEGQLVLGAIAAGGVALFLPMPEGGIKLTMALAAGILGGMAWAAVPALLRTRFHTNEILVSLMLVYVAELLVRYLVNGPWKDPAGFNFPQSAMFAEATMLSPLVDGLRVNAAFPAALVLAGLAWVFCYRTVAGFRMQVSGLAPGAASYAGFSHRANVWLALMIGGGAAGLAGAAEVLGPLGQLQPSISPGYGFAAIIVAFVGRLHPLGVLLAALLMSLIYLGGESAQMRLALPSAITGLFQGLLLFYLLAADLFIHYRLRPQTTGPARAAGVS